MGLSSRSLAVIASLFLAGYLGALILFLRVQHLNVAGGDDDAAAVVRRASSLRQASTRLTERSPSMSKGARRRAGNASTAPAAAAAPEPSEPAAPAAPERRAYATLVCDDESALPATALMVSLLRTGTSATIVPMLGSAVTGVVENVLARLARGRVVPVRVSDVPYPFKVRQAESDRGVKRACRYTKLRAWSLVDFDRVVVIRVAKGCFTVPFYLGLRLRHRSPRETDEGPPISRLETRDDLQEAVSKL